jgi:hypothetical protein
MSVVGLAVSRGTIRGMSKTTGCPFPCRAARARNWALFGPPARPSAGETAAYARFAGAEQSRPEGSWALFGATPEIRSLAARAGRPLYCLDRDGEVFRTLAALRDAAGEEHFVEGDWLTAAPPRRCSVVFADGSMNMLPPDLHAAFVDKLRATTGVGGLVLLRVHLAQPPRHQTPRAVFEWYRAESAGVPVFTATRTDLDMLWLEPDTLRIRFPDVHRRIEALHAEDVITQDEFHGYDRLAAFNEIDLYYTTRARLDALIDSRFVIEACIDGGDYPGSPQHPIFALRAA